MKKVFTVALVLAVALCSALGQLGDFLDDEDGSFLVEDGGATSEISVDIFSASDFAQLSAPAEPEAQEVKGKNRGAKQIEFDEVKCKNSLANLLWKKNRITVSELDSHLCGPVDPVSLDTTYFAFEGTTQDGKKVRNAGVKVIVDAKTKSCSFTDTALEHLDTRLDKAILVDEEEHDERRLGGGRRRYSYPPLDYCVGKEHFGPCNEGDCSDIPTLENKQKCWDATTTYHFSSTASTQTAAKAACAALGGRLVTADSTAIRDKINGLGDVDIWVGAELDDTKYKWADGTEVNGNWAAGEPTTANACVVMLDDTGLNEFAAKPCTDTNAYVCEVLPETNCHSGLTKLKADLEYIRNKIDYLCPDSTFFNGLDHIAVCDCTENFDLSPADDFGVKGFYDCFKGYHQNNCVNEPKSEYDIWERYDGSYQYERIKLHHGWKMFSTEEAPCYSPIPPDLIRMKHSMWIKKYESSSIWQLEYSQACRFKNTPDDYLYYNYFLKHEGCCTQCPCY